MPKNGENSRTYIINYIDSFQNVERLQTSSCGILAPFKKKVFLLSAEHATSGYHSCFDGAICFRTSGGEWGKDRFFLDNSVVIVSCYDNSL